MSDDVEERLDAVERALTDTDVDLPSLAADAELVERVESLADRLDAAEERIEELDAAVQAVRGYVGNVRSVNEDVEQRANAAVAGVDALEARLDDIEAGRNTGTDRSDQTGDGRRRAQRSEAIAGTASTTAADNGAATGDEGSERDGGVVARLRDAL